jgi:hypothetical protein
MKLGELLLHRRKIDRDQLNEALRRQSHGARPLGEILLEMGVIARDEVIEALLDQPSPAAGADALDLVRPSVAMRLPRPIAERFDAVLLIHEGSWACVAMRDPLNTAMREELEAFLGVAVVPIAARGRDLALARERVYAADTQEGTRRKG